MGPSVSLSAPSSPQWRAALAPCRARPRTYAHAAVALEVKWTTDAAHLLPLSPGLLFPFSQTELDP